MKAIRLLFPFLAALAFIASCDELEDAANGSLEIELSTSELQFGLGKDTKTITITSGRDWKAEWDETQTWISVTPSNGEGSGSAKTISITADANDGFERGVQIIFTNGLEQMDQILTVTQAGDATYTDISAVRAHGTESALPRNTVIKGTVISNKAVSSTANANLFIQDETAGLCVRFSVSEDNEFQFGEVLALDLSDMVPSEYNGVLQINNFTSDKVRRIGNATVEPKTVSITDFLANKYESQYVAIENVQSVVATAQKWSDNKSNISFADQLGNTFVVYTTSYASYKSEAVPTGSGTIKGIASRYNSTMQLFFTQTSDYAGLTGERFGAAESVDMTISEFYTTEEPAVKVKGQVVAIDANYIIINDGSDKCLNIYAKTAPSGIAVGDVVAVEGANSTYGRTDAGYTQLKQIGGENVVVTKIDENIVAKTIPAVAMTADQVDAPFSADATFLLTIEATATISGKYVNLDFGGTIPGSVQGTAGKALFQDGVRYLITGYYGGISNGATAYFNIIPTSVAPSTGAYFAVKSTELQAGSTATSAKIVINGNVPWTAESQTAGFTLDKTTGEGAAEITVTFAANDDPDNAKVATVKVSTTADVTVKEYVVTITQAKKAAGSYVKVTAAPSDWTGTYLLGYEEEGKVYVFNGVDASNGYILVDLNAGSIENSSDMETCKVQIAAMDGGWSLKHSKGYLYGKSGENKLNFNTTTAQLNTMAFNTDCTVNIISNTSYLTFNSASDNMRFRYYKESTATGTHANTYKRPTLYRLAE